jgi:hypothetical protein
LDFEGLFALKIGIAVERDFDLEIGIAVERDYSTSR